MRKQIILLHGAIGSKLQLERLKKSLSDFADVYSFSFSGHGGIQNQVEFSMELFVADLDQFIKENNIEDPCLFGYSMGGYVALSYAMKYPNSIQKIASYGTKFDWTVASAAKEIQMLNPEKIELKVPVFAKALEMMHAPLDWKVVLKNTADLMENLSNGKAFTPEQLVKIDVPVQLGVGSEDNMVSIAETENIASFLPNATVKIYQKQSHPIQQLNIEILTKEIINFFNQ